MGLRFANIERKIGEIERARSIYTHLSQFCNPSSKTGDGSSLWKIWEKFEVTHGDQDTYTDYLRTKKTVELRYSTIMTNQYQESNQNE